MIHTQIDFTGGIRTDLNPLKLPENAYSLGVNIRNRGNELAAVLSPLEQEVPAGVKQLIVGVAQYLVVFIAGQAFYRDTSVDGAVFLPIPDIQLSATAQDIDYEIIPAATVNTKRIGGVAMARDNIIIAGSPAAMLVTDGETQPWIITAGAAGPVARITQRYDEWVSDTTAVASLNQNSLQEYVPIGRYPCWVGNKLYMAIKDSTGVLNLIAQSVSGRPLDFVIAISDTGDKVADAYGTCHAVGKAPITSIKATSAGTGNFVVSMLEATVGVTPLLNAANGELIYGEPTFQNTPLFPTGAIGQNCSANLNGDIGFITQRGVQAFNAVLQLTYESANLPFTAKVAKYFAAAPQTRGAAINFDDYALFSVDTVFGPAILVYDTTNESFASVDIWRRIRKVTQFAITTFTGRRQLWLITADNRLYQAYGAAEYETARLYAGEWTTEQDIGSQVCNELSLQWSDVRAPFDIQVTAYVDRLAAGRAIQRMVTTEQQIFTVSPIPFASLAQPSVKVTEFDSLAMNAGSAAGFFIEWASASKIIRLACETTESKPPLANTYANAQLTTLNDNFAFIADSGPQSTASIPVGNTTREVNAYDTIISAITKFNPRALLGGGDHLYEDGDAADYVTAFVDHKWPTGIRKVFALGNHDLDTDSGAVWLSHFGGERFYNFRASDNVEFFILNGGYTTARAVLVGADRVAQSPDKEPAGNSTSSAQANWLRQKLANSTATFKVVIVHEPLWCNGLNHYPGYNVLRWIADEPAVDLILCGHSHNYERVNIGGMPQIIVGTGGKSLEGYQDPISSNSVVRRSDSFGWLKIEVNKFTLTTTFVDLTGAEYDKYTIHS